MPTETENPLSATLTCEQAITYLQEQGVTRQSAATAMKKAIIGRSHADLYHGGKRYRIFWSCEATPPPRSLRKIHDYHYTIQET